MTAAHPIRRLSALGAAIALALALAPAAARADTYVVRPTSTGYQDPAWTTSPAGEDLAVALADPIAEPDVPSLSSDYATASSTQNQAWASVALATPAVPAGQSASALTAWFYVRPGAGQSLSLSVWTGGFILGYKTIAAGQPAGWYSVSYSGSLSGSALSHLVLALDAGSGQGTPGPAAYAEYAEVTAPGAGQPAGGGSTGATTTTGGGDVAGTPGAPEAPAAVLSAPTVVLPGLAAVQTLAGPAPHLGVNLECPATSVGGCHGVVTLRLLGAPRPLHGRRSGHAQARARDSRCARGCRNLTRESFSVAAGRRRRVRLPLGRMALAMIPRGTEVRARLTVSSHDAVHPSSTVVRTVTLRRA